MRKRSINLYLAILLIAAFIFSLLTIYAFGDHQSHGFSISARSAALYQPETDEFLYEKNANEKLPMASTTKIMTALVASERAELDELVAIDDSAIGIEGSSAYLCRGDVLTMEELLYALLLQSANDAAVAIACYIGGNVEGFSALMNERAESLGLCSTHFTNPHGLDSDEHYTTARELAIIAAEALKNDSIKEITSQKSRSFITEDRTRIYVNHNKLLSMYDGCIGVKTGYTRKSGRCLVSAAERDGLSFVSVTLDAPSDWSDHKKLLNYGYDCLERLILCSPYENVYTVPVLDGEKNRVTVANVDTASVIRERHGKNITKSIHLVKFTVAPVSRGDILGEVIYSNNGKECARVDLIATEEIKKENIGLLKRILSIFETKK